MIDLPSYQEVCDALRDYMLAIQSATAPSEAYWSLAHTFGLTEEQLRQRRNDGRGSAWENRVQWARRKLVEAGVMERGGHGIWSLTVDYRTQPSD